MKIQKIGRERPILYRGKFVVPHEVVSRLAVAQNHLMLAQIANFNGKIDEYYLAIDNLLSAVIAAKEGALTTVAHKKKIDKFFEHLRRRTKLRKIDKTDFYEFYDLWKRSRYCLFFPSSTTIEKFKLFILHLFDFTITEISRFFKSDETILARKMEEMLEIFRSETILEEVSHIHEYHQMEAERIGEMYGAKLGMKLSNPWNFMEIYLLSDRLDIINIVDESTEIRKILVSILKNWDNLISKIQNLNFKQIALKVAKAKMAKRQIDTNAALSEAIEAASTHPQTHSFRLVLNFRFDPSEPKRIGAFFSRLIRAERELIKNPNKAVKSGWEIYKEYS